MKSGKTVILEWGYSYDKNDINLMDINDLNYKTIYKRFIEKAFQSGGTYDGMMGIITNWEWSVSDDGSIECTTKISSMGLDILKQQVTPVDDIGISRKSKPNASGNDELQTVPSITFNKFINQIKSKLGLWISTNGNVSYAEKRALTVSNAHNFFFAGDEQELYLSWGWIEDNILSRYLSKINKSGEILNSIRSIEPYLDKSGNHLSINDALKAELYSGDELKIINSMSEKTRKETPAHISTEISNHKFLISPNYKFFILPGQISKGPKDLDPINHSILYDVSNTSAFSRFSSGKSLDSDDDNIEYGYMRNILFN